MTTIREKKAKLSKPMLCPTTLYTVMCQTWTLEPQSRPQAAELHARIEDMTGALDLEEYIHSHPWPTLASLKRQNPPPSSSAWEEATLDPTDSTAVNALSALEVPRTAVRLDKQLGAGAFGTVHAGILLESSKPVAVKQIKSTDSDLQAKFLLEARILASLKHPHIVQLVAVVTTDMPFMMVMELMGGGDLLKYMRARANQIPVPELVDVCRQICSAMDHLGRLHVIHRDLAARCVMLIAFIVWVVVCFIMLCCSNVLVSAQGHSCVKLSDLGLSRTTTSSPYYIKSSNDRVRAWVFLDIFIFIDCDGVVVDPCAVDGA